MKKAHLEPEDDMRMSSKKFDRIMRLSLQTKPKDPKKEKGSKIKKLK